MPKVTFMFQTPSGQTKANAPIVAEGRPGESILSVALRAKVSIEHACEGCCACATCHVIVDKGMASLSPISEREEDMLDHAWSVGLGSRLSCQACLGSSDLTVLIPCYSNNLVGEADLAHNPSMLASSDQVSQSTENPPYQQTPLGCSLDWTDAEAIAQALDRTHPEVAEPQWVRFTDLHAWVCDLQGFSGDPNAATEQKLESILLAWMELK